MLHQFPQLLQGDHPGRIESKLGGKDKKILRTIHDFNVQVEVREMLYNKAIIWNEIVWLAGF